MRRLEGRTILVAGGGGIGEGLATRFASEGANVVVGDIVGATAEAIAHEIVTTGGLAIATRLDGSNEQSLAGAVALCRSEFNGLDGAHLNFATFVDGGNDTGVLDLAVDDFDETMRVNLRGFYLGTRAVLPALLERGAGSIIYTGSVAAYRGEPTRVAYAIAKAGGLALMRHVASRHGAQGIRANVIAPGTILHEKWEDTLPQDMKDWLLSQALIKSRLGRPSDIAGLATLLMSDEGAYITGQVMCVDGGVSMRA